MPTVDYDWDPDKADTNVRKHGIQFSDAIGVLHDERALVREDLHIVGERRFVATGMDFLGHILTVVFTHRQETMIRLISARRATRKERRIYERGTPMGDEISEMRPEYDMGHAKRGSFVPPDPRKTRITIRIDTQILNWFRNQVEQAGVEQGLGDRSRLARAAEVEQGVLRDAETGSRRGDEVVKVRTGRESGLTGNPGSALFDRIGQAGLC